MKEIIKIHLARIPYNIEAGAKKDLEKYLETIEKVMHADEDALREIETRMVELLAERDVARGGVISASDVAALKETMGAPTAFSDEETVEETLAMKEKDAPATPKRLMRDMDNRWIGGVCAGLAAYVGIEVIWVRLIALALLLVSVGAAAIIYIILLLVIPPALTATEKLQMRGEAVTLRNLQQESSQVSVPRGTPTALRVMGAIIGLVAAGVAVSALFLLVLGIVTGGTYIGLFREMSAYPWVIALYISLIVAGITLVIFSSLVAYSGFAWRMNRRIGISIGGVFLVGILLMGLITSFSIKIFESQMRDTERYKKTITLEIPSTINLDEIKKVFVEPVGAMTYYSPHEPGGDPLKIRLSYWSNFGKPNVVITEKDGTLFVTMKDNYHSDARYEYSRLSPFAPQIFVENAPTGDENVIQ